MLGFIRGIPLERHPLRPAKTQVTDTAGGSASIPDSLVHKPVDTSGRAAWSTPSPLHRVLLPHLDPHPPSPFIYFIPYRSLTPFHYGPRSRFRPRWPARGRVRRPAETGAGTGEL